MKGLIWAVIMLSFNVAATLMLISFGMFPYINCALIGWNLRDILEILTNG